jgi:hypothetical protein
MNRLSLAIAIAGLSGTVAAQATPFTITSVCNPNLVFNYVTYPTTPTATSGGSQNLRCAGAAGQDQLFESWWWYRINADTREFAFNNGATSGLAPQVIDAKGDKARLNWTNTDGRGFDAELRYWAYSTGAAPANGGVLSQCMKITNNTGAPLRLNLYNYTDFDVCATAGTDSSTFQGMAPIPSQQIVTDPACALRMGYLGCRHTNFQTGAFAAVRTLLTNAVVDNLNNTVAAFGPGDWTSAYQWMDIVIPPGGDFTACVALSCDFLVPCCNRADIASYCVPKPGTNGIPRWGNNPWPVGGAVELKVLNGLPMARPVVLVGVGRPCFPFPPFGTLAVNPIAFTFNMPAFDAAGVSRLCFTLTNDPSLCGGKFDMQAWFLDPGAAGAPLAHTDGCSFTFGSVF